MVVSPLVYHPAYQAYNFGPEHPFSPQRLAMLLDLLAALGHTPELIEPAPATREDVLTVHSESLVAQVEAASAGHPLPDAHRFGLGTSDVPFFEGMDDAARALVGGTLQAARIVSTGQAHRVLQLGGGLHHAQHAQATGFCVYNDLAVALHDFRQQGLRVVYLDIDVHHGDGVQWLYYNNPDVLTISLHESGRYLYPGTGDVHELGTEAGKGFSLNVPLEPFTQDESYLEVFERVVPFALAQFRPDVLLVQCGADAHAADPLANLLLTSHAYETVFRRILALADEFTEGRIVLTLGGGYNLDATVRIWTMLALLVHNLPLPKRLPETWLSRWQPHCACLLSPNLHDTEHPVPISRKETIAQHNRQASKQVLEMAAPYWYGV